MPHKIVMRELIRDVSPGSTRGVLLQQALRAVELGIADAKTTEQRHKLIQQLPVTIEHQPSVSGEVLIFVARGRERMRLVVPATPHSVDASSSVSGPSADEPKDDCYDGPGDCVSWGDMADLAALAADTQAEVESAQADLESSSAALDDFCANNPGMCDAGAPFFVSGPSAEGGERFSCTTEIGNALLGIGTALGITGGVALGVAGAGAAGVTITSGMMTVLVGAIYFSGAGALLLVGVAGYCIYKAIWAREPILEVLAEFTEPMTIIRALE